MRGPRTKPERGTFTGTITVARIRQTGRAARFVRALGRAAHFVRALMTLMYTLEIFGDVMIHLVLRTIFVLCLIFLSGISPCLSGTEQERLTPQPAVPEFPHVIPIPPAQREQESANVRIVTLDELIAEALENNPEIAAARRRFEAATKRPGTAAALPDPTISLANFGVGHPFSRPNGSEFAYYGLGFSQEIPFPGKLSLRKQIAQKEAESERQMFRDVGLRLISSVKRAYYDLFQAYKTLEILEKNRDFLEKIAKITEAKYRVGSGIQQDLVKAQLEISLLAQRIEVAEQQRASQEASILALLRRPLDSTATRIKPAETKRSELTYSVERLFELARENSPRLRSRRELVESKNFAVDLAKKDYLPDFNATFQYQKTGSHFPDYYMTMVEVKVPLYFWRKQRLGVEEAAATLAQSRNEYQAETQGLFFGIKDQFLLAKTSERLLALYEQAVIPQATTGVESALAAYESGKVDFLNVMNSLTGILNYEMDYYKQLTDQKKSLAKLEELVGVPLT